MYAPPLAYLWLEVAGVEARVRTRGWSDLEPSQGRKVERIGPALRTQSPG